MTFPSPFDTPEPPGAEQAFALQAEHGQAIQAIADRLYQAGAEAQKKLKTTLATGIKGKLVRPAAREQKANSQERTRIAAQMRHDGEIAQADNDAEIMRLAPRLGAYEAEAARLPPAPAPNCIPPPGASAPAGECRSARPFGPFDLRPQPPPPGWHRVVDALGYCWDCPDSPPPRPPGPPPIPPPVPPPIPPPPPPPAPPPPPPPCPPCPPTRCTPDGTPLLGPPLCPQGPPADAQHVAVYVVPWLEPGDAVPSTTSQCGRKIIDDALGSIYPAQRMADALRVRNGLLSYLPQPPPETVGSTLTGYQ